VRCEARAAERRSIPIPDEAPWSCARAQIVSFNFANPLICTVVSSAKLFAAFDPPFPCAADLAERGAGWHNLQPRDLERA